MAKTIWTDTNDTGSIIDSIRPNVVGAAIPVTLAAGAFLGWAVSGKATAVSVAGGAALAYGALLLMYPPRPTS